MSPVRTAPSWRNRITGSGTLKVAEAARQPLELPAPPGSPVSSPRGLPRQVGWVQQVVVNTTTGNMIDGHLRLELARAARRDRAALPVRRAL